MASISVPRRKKRGRPRKIPTKLVRISQDVVDRARIVAKLGQFGLGDYMTQRLRPLVDRDFDRVLEESAAPLDVNLAPRSRATIYEANGPVD